MYWLWDLCCHLSYGRYQNGQRRGKSRNRLSGRLSDMSPLQNLLSCRWRHNYFFNKVRTPHGGLGINGSYEKTRSYREWFRWFITHRSLGFVNMEKPLFHHIIHCQYFLSVQINTTPSTRVLPLSLADNVGFSNLSWSCTCIPRRLDNAADSVKSMLLKGEQFWKVWFYFAITIKVPAISKQISV